MPYSKPYITMHPVRQSRIEKVSKLKTLNKPDMAKTMYGVDVTFENGDQASYWHPNEYECLAFKEGDVWSYQLYDELSNPGRPTQRVKVKFGWKRQEIPLEVLKHSHILDEFHKYISLSAAYAKDIIVAKLGKVTAAKMGDIDVEAEFKETASMMQNWMKRQYLVEDYGSRGDHLLPAEIYKKFMSGEYMFGNGIVAGDEATREENARKKEISDEESE